MWSKSWVTSLHGPRNTVSQNLKRAKEESPVLPVFLDVIGMTWWSMLHAIVASLHFTLSLWRTTRKLKLQCKFVWRRPQKELIFFISRNAFWFSHLRGNQKCIMFECFSAMLQWHATLSNAVELGALTLRHICTSNFFLSFPWKCPNRKSILIDSDVTFLKGEIQQGFPSSCSTTCWVSYRQARFYSIRIGYMGSAWVRHLASGG